MCVCVCVCICIYIYISGSTRSLQPSPIRSIRLMLRGLTRPALSESFWVSPMCGSLLCGFGRSSTMFFEPLWIR